MYLERARTNDGGAFPPPMLFSRGSYTTFLERPISATMLGLAALLLAWALYSSFRAHRRARATAAES